MPTDLFDIEDCDDSGATDHVIEPEPEPAPLMRPLSHWLSEIARILDETVTPAPAAAAR